MTPSTVDLVSPVARPTPSWTLPPTLRTLPSNRFSSMPRSSKLFMEPFLAWKVPRLAQPEPRAAAKTNWRLLKPREHQSRFRDMLGKPQSVAINQAERELDETNGLVTQQYRQQRLSYLRMRGTGADAGKVLPSKLREDLRNLA